MIFKPVELEASQIYLLEDRVLVDIRSPQEFQDSHIPGAINIPLFEDQEKALIGFIYRTEGVEKAMEVGYNIAVRKLDLLVNTFKELSEKHKNVVVYCWRGGMRSQELCKFLAQAGIRVLRLKGGYRAYRQFILSDLPRLINGRQFLVITGKTGVGKTKILRRLKEEGFPVLDLEGLAMHRGSVFGHIGMEGKVSQKMFEALIYEELRSMPQGVILVEDESRCIGNLHLPDALWWKKEEAPKLELLSSMERRIKNIIEEYTRFEGWKEMARDALLRLEKHLGPQKLRTALDLLEKDNVEEFVRILLKEHYDKRYRIDPYRIVGRVDCEDEESCLQQVANFYSRMSLKPEAASSAFLIS